MKMRLLTLPILLMSFAFSVPGQSTLKTRSVIIKQVNELIDAEILIKNVEFNLKTDRIYSSFFKEKLIETRGGYSGHLLHGRCTFYFPSDRLKKQGNFILGLKSGEWRHWNNQGRLVKTESWKNGRKSGVFKEFDSEGNLVKKGTYKNGELHGNLTIYESGEVVEKIYYKNGKESVKKRFWDVRF